MSGGGGGGGGGGSSGSGSRGFGGWPGLGAKAAYRGKQLELEEKHDGLFLIENAFSPDECQAMIAAVEATGQMVSTNPRNLPARKGYAFRNNERYLLRDEAFAARLFEFLRPALSRLVRPEDGATPVGLNPDFRFYRYQRGHSFGPHIDEPVESADRASVSLFTLLLYLTGGDDAEPLGGERLRGGATLFHLRDRPVEVQPKTGTICLHYVLHDFLHEGEIVQSGSKWLLRTDVFWPKLRPGASAGRTIGRAVGGGEGGKGGAAGAGATAGKGGSGGGGGKKGRGKKG